jgi:hypothetical protein
VWIKLSGFSGAVPCRTGLLIREYTTASFI